MTEVMKNHLLSYVKNGTDKGQTMNFKNVETSENSLKFEAEYSSPCMDWGTVKGEVKFVEEGTIKKVLIKSTYNGKKACKPYEYSQETGFEMTDYKDKNTRMVYKTSQITREGFKEPVRSTNYITRTSLDNSLGDYFYNCGNPIDFYHAEHKIKQLQAKK